MMNRFVKDCLWFALAMNLTAINAKAISINDSTATKVSRISIGGYGEAVMSRMFYSDNWKRYTDAAKYKDAPSNGQFDLPHVVLMLGYDFGHGWTMGSEMEFEHGGTESATEIEEEETGEYESEIERGGEFALEQFWLQRSFSSKFNIRMGMIVIPVGLTNSGHLPNQFFTVYRPEGENTMMPCTWHEVGISIWGKVPHWRYELQFIPGLDADRMNNRGWIHNASGSPYEYKIATAYAGVLRIDNYSIKGLRLGMSGYIGNSGSNSLKHANYEGVKGTVSIGTFDFEFNKYNWIVRGNLDYGHLSNSARISAINKNLSAYSPSSRTNVGSDAIAAGTEIGYNLFSQFEKVRESQKLYVFGRYEYYDTMYKTEGGILDEECWGRQKVTVGMNYYPVKSIGIKADYSVRLLKSQYNNEPALSIGITYAGLFM